jgi:hypothetical protein
MNYPKLPIDFKEKWIAELRSGKYPQGRCALKTILGGYCLYCCLGVAAEISGYRDIVGKQWIDNKMTKVPEMLRGDDTENDLLDRLSLMNDGGRLPAQTFPEIADWIEENL